MANKKELGQFYTVKWREILHGMEQPPQVPVVEPCCGAGHMLSFLTGDHELELYDVDPSPQPLVQGIVIRDTLLNPPNYAGKFVLTNPPYLAKNKTQDHGSIFAKYNVDDLYKAFMVSIIENVCVGGIVIIPLNFWSSIRKADADLRKRFLTIYSVKRVNVMGYPVFDDTTYTVCGIEFTAGRGDAGIDFYSYSAPNVAIHSRIPISAPKWTIGAELYDCPNTYSVDRLTSRNYAPDTATRLCVKCIDDSVNNQIHMWLDAEPDKYVDRTKNLSARSYVQLLISPAISEDVQQRLVAEFNAQLAAARTQYMSLFLTNYRESTTCQRKRISFDLIYCWVKRILDNFDVQDAAERLLQLNI